MVEAARDRWAAARRQLQKEMAARRQHRHALSRRAFWGWKRVAHHAALSEVRWVQRGHRRVALKKEVVDHLESHLHAWQQYTYVVREARRRFGFVGQRILEEAFYALSDLVARRKKIRRLVIGR